MLELQQPPLSLAHSSGMLVTHSYPPRLFLQAQRSQVQLGSSWLMDRHSLMSRHVCCCGNAGVGWGWVGGWVGGWGVGRWGVGGGGAEGGRAHEMLPASCINKGSKR